MTKQGGCVPKLLKSHFAFTMIAMTLNWVQQFLIEDADMLHSVVLTLGAAVVVIHGPFE